MSEVSEFMMRWLWTEPGIEFRKREAVLAQSIWDQCEKKTLVEPDQAEVFQICNCSAGPGAEHKFYAQPRRLMIVCPGCDAWGILPQEAQDGGRKEKA